MGDVICARELTKIFRTAVRRRGAGGALRGLIAPRRQAHHAVDGVSFTVGEAELVALLGPNGAGKSTTIKMLTGILTPTRGSALVAGLEPYRERIRNARNIGAVFGQRTQLWWDLPAQESFAILRDIYGVSERAYRARIREFDDLLELSAFWQTRVRHLSLGQRVRCDLAAALLHDPTVVFLDEPTIGMDVVVKEQVRGFLRHQVEQRGRTVLLTTHDMTEVSRLAERVIVINEGRIALDGSLADVQRRFGSWRVRITVADGPVPGPAPDGLALLHTDGPVAVFGPSRQRGDVPPAPGAEPSARQALKLLIERYDVTDIAVEETDLEDVMRAAYAVAGTAADQP